MPVECFDILYLFVSLNAEPAFNFWTNSLGRLLIAQVDGRLAFQTRLQFRDCDSVHDDALHPDMVNQAEIAAAIFHVDWCALFHQLHRRLHPPHPARFCSSDQKI